MSISLKEDSEPKDSKLGHSERMQYELDEASKMMEMSLSLCNNVFEEEEQEETAKGDTLTNHSQRDTQDSRSKRLTTLSSLSSSQPGKTGYQQVPISDIANY